MVIVELADDADRAIVEQVNSTWMEIARYTRRELEPRRKVRDRDLAVVEAGERYTRARCRQIEVSKQHSRESISVRDENADGVVTGGVLFMNQ
ncbi:MAG: hypothetical protein ACI841_003112 [Planctomycetota bacterium]|jgi:hypothetical protein